MRDLGFHGIRFGLGVVPIAAIITVIALAGIGAPAAAAENTGAKNDGEAQEVHYEPYPIAVLRTLDKITGRANTIEVPIDQETKFGTLMITVKACYKRPPEETPEKAAFLIIYDEKPDEPPEKSFSGWMFASSPALSALEHPVYDLWVLDCEKKMSKSPETQAQPQN